MQPTKPGTYRFQRRDKHWFELVWTGRVVTLREGSPGNAASERRKTLADEQAARVYVVSFLRRMHNKLFQRVERIVDKGTLAVAKHAPSERRKARREMDREIERSEQRARPRTVRMLEATARKLRPSRIASDGRRAAEMLVTLAAALARLPGTRVKTRFGKPASTRALARCEQALGVALPPSLRSYLAVQDGATAEWKGPLGAGSIELASTRGLAQEYTGIRRGWPENEPESVLIAALRPIEIFHGDVLVALDTRKRGDKGELAVVALWRPYGPRQFVVLAPDFATFVARRVTDGLVLRGVGDAMERRLPALRRALARVRS